MRIIPAIDLIDGKCVRLTKGDYSTKIMYNENPLEVAKAFEDNGIEYLHLVDLDGAKSNRIVNYQTLERLATNTRLNIDFGGGIKTNEDLKIAFDCGSRQVTVGSIAAKNQELFLEWLRTYGSDRIILGADCMNRKIATNGWLKQSETDVVEYIAAYQQKGVDYVICTDIAKDGMLEGTSNELYLEIMESTPVQLIASGGVSSMQDIEILKTLGCEGAIVGKAIYEGKITLTQLNNWLS